jgi:hypothetical protein
MGGAASLYTNRPSLRHLAHYQLMHAVRTHHGGVDEGYECMSWGPDSKGVNGEDRCEKHEEEGERAAEVLTNDALGVGGVQ